FYYPRKWEDYSVVTKISDVRPGDRVVIQATIKSISVRRSPGGRMLLTQGILADDSGEISAIWYHQPFLKKTLAINSQWIFAGKVNRKQGTLSVQGKSLLESPIYIKEPRILPVYPETSGLTSRQLRRLIEPLTKNIAGQIDDWLPENISKNRRLMDLPAAIVKIHFPDSQTELKGAKRRISFDELLLINLNVQMAKQNLQQFPAPAILIDRHFLADFAASLPFRLTNDQRRAAWIIIQDLNKSAPMNRLLEGDVGSGKTVVAVLAAAGVIKQGFQVAYLAPTEILAQQQYQNISRLLKPLKTTMALLTSSTTQTTQIQNAKCKSQNDNVKLKIKKLIGDNKIQLIIGTHAILQEDVEIPKLALIIVDEQHRFGVKQRANLRQRQAADHNRLIPHFLSMTATPIPRTLALALYGDLDISLIKEMPIGRRPVETRVVNPRQREMAYQFIRKQVAVDRQIFVICPLIEEPTRLNLFDIDRKSVKKEYEKLSGEVFPDLKIGLLHGQLPAKEKEKVMADFKANKINILVSTAVVEVGIDVPNAAVMMIEGADRFGLAQLHQFRGRVGRSQHQSYCFLFPETISGLSSRRLKIFSQCHNGFRLAEEDLRLRGPGEFSGLVQHGLPDLKMASLNDTILLKETREVSREILADGMKKYPKIKNKLNEFAKERFLE
ncbi:MAG: ATP-dependent DNA helicase RecG, partial [Candidatus Berkelbacteria bacterium Licking1014_2]